MALNQKSFGDIIAFTRASSATRINSLGVMESVAANVPRIDYDPITLAVRGLLVEEQRTNLVSRSEGLNQVPWTLSGATVSDSFLAPNGTMTAQKLVESAANVEHFASIPTTYSSGAVLAVSVFAKKAERSQIDFSTDGTPFGGAVQRVRFDLDAETVTSVSGSSVGKLTKYKDGWFRCEAVMPATSTSGTNAFARVRLNNAGQAPYAGDGSSGLLLWGVQVEIGGFASSYISTAGSQVTRSIADAKIGSLVSWFSNQGGALYVEYEPIGGDGFIAEFHDNSLSNRWRMFRSNAGSMTSGATSGGVGDGDVTTASGVSPSNQVRRAAMSLASNNLRISVSGGAIVKDSTVTLPANLAVLQIGARQGLTTPFNGWLRKFRHYPKDLTDSDLIYLSTYGRLPGEPA